MKSFDVNIAVKWRKREVQLLSREFMTLEKERMHGKTWRWVGGIPSFAASIEPGNCLITISADRRISCKVCRVMVLP